MALHNKTKKAKEILPFVTTFNPATPNIKKILMKHWHINQQQPRLAHIFKQSPIVSCIQKGKNTQGHFSPRKTSVNHAAIIKTKKFVFKLEARKFTYNLVPGTCSTSGHASFSATQLNNQN